MLQVNIGDLEMTTGEFGNYWLLAIETAQKRYRLREKTQYVQQMETWKDEFQTAQDITLPGRRVLHSQAAQTAMLCVLYYGVYEDSRMVKLVKGKIT